MVIFSNDLREPWQIAIAALYAQLKIDIAAVHKAAATTIIKENDNAE